MVGSIAVMMMALSTDAGAPLAGTEPLTMTEDLAEAMVAGINRYLTRELAASVEGRAAHWQRDTSSQEAYEASVAGNRERLAVIAGVVDTRVAANLEFVFEYGRSSRIGGTEAYAAHHVRWRVLEGVDAEGLLLDPGNKAIACVVALPDCDWCSEGNGDYWGSLLGRCVIARRLAASGCQVLIPVLLDRRDTYAGNPAVRMTNQPHREFIYRAAFQMGRHIIGYEVQKTLAAVDWFREKYGEDLPVGVIGYGEGGLVALYAAALDTRIDAAAVSGYFQPREAVWSEPIYRNVWALLTEFGDAEIASLVVPRALIVEASKHPEVSGPPEPQGGRRGAAPGAITTPDAAEVRRELERARSMVAALMPPWNAQCFEPEDGEPGSGEALQAFLHALQYDAKLAGAEGEPEFDFLVKPHKDKAMKRQFDQLLAHTQRVMRESQRARKEFWAKANASDVQAWEKSAQWYRDYLWDEVIGRLPEATMPANPRTRQVFDEPEYRGYEVVIDVYPDVFASGILLVPKGLAGGERRPVVVCQHGLEGTPRKAADPEVHIDAYNQYGCRLAERGFVVYAPQNPYIGGDAFRVLQRMANPLKKSLFSFIVRQHERTLEWLGAQPFVDPARIGFYGISYGGKTAMRVPALLPGYCLSICSADYNEWIWKTVSADNRYSYLFTGEYEMDEFNLGNTFNHAEMSWLIFPRPFMVERGHHDGVAPDEWVAYEYARTFRHYNLLGLGDRTEIEFFDGPHAIHGVGTFAFLHKHLEWAAP